MDAEREGVEHLDVCFLLDACKPSAALRLRLEGQAEGARCEIMVCGQNGLKDGKNLFTEWS